MARKQRWHEKQFVSENLIVLPNESIDIKFSSKLQFFEQFIFLNFDVLDCPEIIVTNTFAIFNLDNGNSIVNKFKKNESSFMQFY